MTVTSPPVYPDIWQSTFTRQRRCASATIVPDPQLGVAFGLLLVVGLRLPPEANLGDGPGPTQCVMHLTMTLICFALSAPE